MARGAAQTRGKQRPKAEPKRSKRAAPTYEQAMFFPRLRRQAKWVFVFLALVFAVGFVAFGVGSGSNGLSDVLNGNFFGGGGSGTSSQIKDNEKKIERNPKNIEAYLSLSGLYQQEQQEDKAIAVLRKAATVAPKNVDVLNRLAGIYSGRAQQALTDAQTIQLEIQDTQTLPPFVDPTSNLGQAFSQDAYTQSLNTRLNEATTKATNAFRTAEDAYKHVVTAAKGTSAEAGAQLQLGSIASSPVLADYSTAIAAFKRYLKLNPNGTNAAAVRSAIQQLQAALPKTQG
jgi:tetratricopeptide (TPR) repeat protein